MGGRRRKGSVGSRARPVRIGKTVLRPGQLAYSLAAGVVFKHSLGVPDDADVLLYSPPCEERKPLFPSTDALVAFYNVATAPPPPSMTAYVNAMRPHIAAGTQTLRELYPYTKLLHSPDLSVTWRAGVGYGVFAKTTHHRGNAFADLTATRVNITQPEETALEARKEDFSIVYHPWDKHGRVRRFLCLGPLAFINHACLRCANVVPTAGATAKEYTDQLWTSATALCTIVPGEELLVNYHEEHQLPCAKCGQRSKPPIRRQPPRPVRRRRVPSAYRS